MGVYADNKETTGYDLQLENAILEFDIISFLEEQGIDYTNDSKNVGSDWIGVLPCPNCGDTSYHCGINRDVKTYSCWICGNSGSLFKYMYLALGIKYKDARDIIMNSINPGEEDIEERVKNIFKKKEQQEEKELIFIPIDLPKGSRKINSKILNKNPHLKNLLYEKHITLENAKTFGLRLYGDQLVTPVQYQQELVAYQLRQIHYKSYYNTENLKHFLFDYDSIPKGIKLILVEGIWDFISTNNFLIKYNKLDYYCTTSFSKSLTHNQIKLINGLEPKMVLFLLDRDFWFDYQKYCGYFCCPSSFLICPVDSDPNMMTEKDFLQLGL